MMNLLEKLEFIDEFATDPFPHLVINSPLGRGVYQVFNEQIARLKNGLYGAEELLPRLTGIPQIVVYNHLTLDVWKKYKRDISRYFPSRIKQNDLHERHIMRHVELVVADNARCVRPEPDSVLFRAFWFMCSAKVHLHVAGKKDTVLELEGDDLFLVVNTDKSFYSIDASPFVSLVSSVSSFRILDALVKADKDDPE